MPLRISKVILVFSVALFYTIVVFNNITDYGSNYQFVQHVLSMDTTFPGNRGMWRAIHSPLIYQAFYASIIAWEAITAFLCWRGGIVLAQNLGKAAEVFNSAKRTAVIALTVGMLLWFVAFLTIGGEWFLMWQSKIWNGQEAAFRMFTVIGIVLVFLTMTDRELQP